VAGKRSTPKELPDAVRDAVERTVQATAASAQTTRDRAQGAVDDLVKGAEEGLVKSREAVRDALDERRPATQEDIKELRSDLRAIVRRLDGIEQRLPVSKGSKSAKGRKAAGKGSKAAKGSKSRRR
jgi:polyhydroxyalkanoate synthesis regulator phasin